jgi:hypothetical protein
MSWLRRAPRQVYEVHGEDNAFFEEGVDACGYTAPPLDTGAQDAGASRAILLVLLVAVTLGATVLVLLHVSRGPSARQPVAGHHVVSGARRRPFPDVPTTAPPQVHTPLSTERHARAPMPPAARPHRRRRRIARGHAEPSKTFTAGWVGEQQPATPRAGGEFEFER